MDERIVMFFLRFLPSAPQLCHSYSTACCATTCARKKRL